MPFFQLSLEVATTHAEFLSELLLEHGSVGQECRESHLLPMPGVPVPPPGTMHMVAFFETLEAAHKALHAAQTQWNAQLLSLEAQEEKDWSIAWREQIGATQTQHLWVGPPWLSPPPGKCPLYIEPKMAFGTGEHPTTRLCLEEIDAFCTASPNATVLDVGTGTGILGMAACKLGAHHALGTDNDPLALAYAQENLALNHIHNMQLSDAELHLLGEEFELVVANIFANALVELAPGLCQKTRKYLVLSGILEPQAEEVRARFVQLGMRLTQQRTSGEWVCLGFQIPRPLPL